MNESGDVDLRTLLTVTKNVADSTRAVYALTPPSNERQTILGLCDTLSSACEAFGHVMDAWERGLRQS